MSLQYPENRTEFLQAFCDLADLNYSRTNTKVAGQRQLDRILDIALDKYSSRRPAENQATLASTAGSCDIPLPADWLIGYAPNERILNQIQNAQAPSNIQYNYSSLQFRNQKYGGGLIGGSNPFDPINQNLSPSLSPPAPRLERPTIVNKWVNGQLLPVFVMKQATLPTQEIQVTYFVKHRIQDGDDETDSIITVEQKDFHIIFDIMSILAAKGKAFSKHADPLKILSGSEAAINSILASITPVSLRK